MSKENSSSPSYLESIAAEPAAVATGAVIGVVVGGTAGYAVSQMTGLPVGWSIGGGAGLGAIGAAAAAGLAVHRLHSVAILAHDEAVEEARRLANDARRAAVSGLETKFEDRLSTILDGVEEAARQGVASAAPAPAQPTAPAPTA